MNFRTFGHTRGGRLVECVPAIAILFLLNVTLVHAGSDWSSIDFCKLTDADYPQFKPKFEKQFSDASAAEFDSFGRSVKDVRVIHDRTLWIDHPKIGKIWRSAYQLDCPLPNGNVNTWFFQGLFTEDGRVWTMPPLGRPAVQFRLLFDADKDFAARKIKFDPDHYFSYEGAAKAARTVLPSGASRETVRQFMESAGVKLRNSFHHNEIDKDVYAYDPDRLWTTEGWLIVCNFDSAGSLIRITDQSGN